MSQFALNTEAPITEIASFGSESAVAQLAATHNCLPTEAFAASNSNLALTAAEISGRAAEAEKGGSGHSIH